MKRATLEIKMKTKQKADKPWPPNMFLEVDTVEINSNGANYCHFKVRQYRNGKAELVGKAVLNLSKEFRKLGFKGNFSLDLFADKMLQYERDKP